MKEIIKKTKKYVNNETGKTVRPLFNIANEVGQILTEKLNADKNIVILGTLLMDVKLKRAMAENRIQDHIKMSVEASKEFLSQFNLDDEVIKKIISCVKEHHRVEEFSCKESEICANADCYKFLHPKGFLRYLCILNERNGNFNKAIEGVLSKMEEKHNILSLDICKQELEPYYQEFKKLLNKTIEGKI